MIKRELAVLALLVAILILGGCIKQEGVGERVISVEELWENRDFYLGEEIVVSGNIRMFTPICTGNECYEENPCCQSCGSSLYLKGSGEITLPFYGKFKGKEVLCQGDNCNLVCYPLKTGENYTIKVLLRKTETRYYLELLKILGQE